MKERADSKANRYYLMGIDLLVLSLLALVTELIGFYALKKYSGAGFSLSLSMLVTIIAVIRWGIVGFMVYPIASCSLLFANMGAMPLDFLVCYYPLAGSFAVLSGFFFLFKQPNEIRDNKKCFVLFQIAAFLSVAIGKGLVTFGYQHNFGIGFMSFMLANIFSIVVGSVISLFLLKRDGLITNMAYLYSVDG